MPSESDSNSPSTRVITPLGLEMVVDVNDDRGAMLARTSGDPNPLSRVLWSALTRSNEWDTVVDVGANYGEMLASVDLSEVGSIIAFEPNDHVRGLLMQTCALLPWKVDVRSEAVAGSAGESDFWEDQSWSGRSGIQAHDALALRGHEVVRRRVRTVSLDEALPESGSVCIKIDVEGSELDVLAGAAGILSSKRAWAIMVELLQLNPADIGYLARRHQLLVLDTDTQKFVRVDGSTVRRTADSLYGDRRYFQDGILLPKNDSTSVARLNAALRDIDGVTTHTLSSRVAVYTALVGGYETLLEQPLAENSGVSFICFTDNPHLTSDTWDIRVVEPHFAQDPVRSARRLKVLGHDDLDPFDFTIWVDNRVILRKHPAELVELMGRSDMLALDHSFRDSVREEFAAVLGGGYDDPTRIAQQLLAYEAGDGHLDEKPIWTGLLVRRRSESMRRAMTEWFENILLHSRRDQLSVLKAVHSSGLRLRRLSLNNRESDLHDWVRTGDARLGRRASPLLTRPGTDQAEPNSDEVTLLDGLTRAFARAMERTEARASFADSQTAELTKARAETKAALKQVRELEVQSRRYRHELRNLKASRTFRVAEKMQRATTWWRRPRRTS